MAVDQSISTTARFVLGCTSIAVVCEEYSIIIVLIYYFLRFSAYTFVDLVKRGVPALVGEMKCTHFQNTEYFIRPTTGN